MTRARRERVSLNDTPYYHCTTRCVRRAFLCGTDGRSEHCYEHRRGWIAHRIKQLSAVFAIDIAAYAVMSNHYHIVMRVDAERAGAWHRDEVIERWTQLFKGPLIIQRYKSGQAVGKAELKVIDEIAENWRSRLTDISWFMRCLNEHIARKANAEDACKGRFWESRFTSQALLDETAVLACMAYVDLNPIRAAMADRPENSDYTSLQERLGIEPEGSSDDDMEADQTALPAGELLPFAGTVDQHTPANHLPYTFADYLELVDWTGRAARDDKRGKIPHHLPSILQRLNIAPEQWLRASTGIEQRFYSAIGPVATLEQFCQKLKKRWIHGTSACRQLYAAPS